MKQIADHVFRLTASPISHVYLVRTGDGDVLIDSGYPASGKSILRELARANVTDLRAVMLTHHDVDHAGGAPFLQRALGTPVYVGAKDLPFFHGASKMPERKNDLSKRMGLESPDKVQPFEGSEMLGIRITHAPGHTPGHCIFTFENVTFTGDLFANYLGRPSNLSVYHADQAQVAMSLEALLDSESEIFCPAHGSVAHNTSRFTEQLRGLVKELNMQLD